MRTVPIMKKLLLVVSVALLGAGLSSCGGSTPAARDNVVTTTSVMAAIVRMVVPDDVSVTSVIPDGKDPHEYQPAPRDIATVSHASVAVGSGFGFDGGLQAALASARSDGATVFVPEWDMPAGWEDGMPAQSDPHWFLNIDAVGKVVNKLADVMGKALGRDLSREKADAVASLGRLEGEVSGLVGQLPPGTCMVGEEHNMLSQLLGPYGCGGAVLTWGSMVPSAEPAAYELERFVQSIRDRKIKVIVRDIAEPSRILRQAADTTGAELVDVSVHGMGKATTYPDFIVGIAGPIVRALQ